MGCLPTLERMPDIRIKSTSRTSVAGKPAVLPFSTSLSDLAEIPPSPPYELYPAHRYAYKVFIF